MLASNVLLSALCGMLCGFVETGLTKKLEGLMCCLRACRIEFFSMALDVIQKNRKIVDGRRTNSD